MWRSQAKIAVVKREDAEQRRHAERGEGAARLLPRRQRHARARARTTPAVPAPSTASDATSVDSGAAPASDATTCRTSGPTHKRYRRAGTPTIMPAASASGDSGVVRS